MKELTVYFNELSQVPYCKDEKEINERVSTFMQLLKSLCDFGLNRLRINTEEYNNWMLNNQLSLQAYLYQNKHHDDADFFYSHVDSPIFDDSSEIKKKIKTSSPMLKKGDEKISCIGLAAAHFGETISISFDSDPYWRNIRFTLVVDDKEHTVYSFSRTEELNDKGFKQWIDDRQDIEILLLDIPYYEKKLNLCGTHHGKSELKQLGKKLLHKKYVVEVTCSIENAGKVTDPIIKVYNDGNIDVADISTDKGYAFKVKTTGRNYRETQYIANMIRDIIKK